MAMQSLLPGRRFPHHLCGRHRHFPDRDGPRCGDRRRRAALRWRRSCSASTALSILIQIGYLAIAALGLNILVGFTGQISIGHAAFFGLGAFTSAYLSAKLSVPVFFAIPLAALVTALVGLVFGLPAARLKGLYLAIATLAAQYILLDFFSRAEWFTGGVVPAIAAPFRIFGYHAAGRPPVFLRRAGLSGARYRAGRPT